MAEWECRPTKRAARGGPLYKNRGVCRLFGVCCLLLGSGLLLRRFGGGFLGSWLVGLLGLLRRSLLGRLCRGLGLVVGHQLFLRHLLVGDGDRTQKVVD